jgi:hypothetical protein
MPIKPGQLGCLPVEQRQGTKQPIGAAFPVP